MIKFVDIHRRGFAAVPVWLAASMVGGIALSGSAATASTVIDRFEFAGDAAKHRVVAGHASLWLEQTLAMEQVFAQSAKEVDGRVRQRVDLGAFGGFVLEEVMRTPSVRESRIVDPRGRLRGMVLQIDTSVGPMLAIDRGDGRVIQVVPLGEDVLRVFQRDGQLPGCLGAVTPPGGVEPGGIGGLAGTCDDGTRLDVLVKWTPTAATQAGGEVAIRAIAEASVAVSNHIYLASGIPLVMRGVGFGETEAYAGDAGDTVLLDLQGTSDGKLDAIHAERDATGADLVALLTGDNPNYCGVAYMLGYTNPGFGFSVTVWDCAIGNLSFTHEVGHNQGCCHAPGDGGGCNSGGVFSYSVGHRFTGTSGTQWRTTMAYSPGIRWPRLSNPLVEWDGVPTGTESADNARTLTETAVAMANFRCEVVSDEGSPIVQAASPLLGVPVDGQWIETTFNGLPLAHAGTQVEFTIMAIADHGHSGEALSLRIGSTNFGLVLGQTGVDCVMASRTTLIPAASYNAAIEAAGDTTFRITASAEVDPVCVGTEMRFFVRYREEPVCGSADSDGDGVGDLCDGCPSDPFKESPGDCGCGMADTDADGNGVSDCLECNGDFNHDGLVDGADLSQLFQAWGNSGGVEDLTGDGLVDGADLGYLLLEWGACSAP
jgi:hypothetical protein